MEVIKLIVVDDHSLIIDGIKSVLSETPEITIIGEALNGKQLLEMLDTKQPDIVLLDIRMPELDGLDTLKIIKTKYSDVKTIMLSQFSERGMIKRSIEFGAKGYLLKDCGKSNLIRAIKRVGAGETCFEIYEINKMITENSNIYCHLSNKEMEVLRLVCKEYTSKEIAKKLSISNETVNTHRGRIMKKIGAKNVIGLYKWALENKQINFDSI
ncbi:MAG: response regulator transcription factor [Bacteroidales bacterium]